MKKRLSNGFDLNRENQQRLNFQNYSPAQKADKFAKFKAIFLKFSSSELKVKL